MDNPNISIVSIKAFLSDENPSESYENSVEKELESQVQQEKLESCMNGNDDPKEKEQPDKSSSGLSVEEIKKINFRIWKSILCMGFAFLLNYVSYGGLFNLQSSLHLTEGMGTICASIRYFSNVVSALFVPKLMITYIGHKWTVSVSFFGFIVWMAANGYGVWATMVPASIINGIFVAPLWTAQGAYFTMMGKEYAALNSKSVDGTITLFFGIFYMFYLGAGVFGNIISSVVLDSSPGENYTEPDPEFVADYCGIEDCPWNVFNNTNLEPVPKNLVWTLVGIYIAIAVLAVIISMVFVDQVPSHLITARNKENSVCHEIGTSFKETMKMFLDAKLLLLLPITFYIGVEETYFFGEFNRSWITCVLGIWMIGFINIPFAIAGTGSSLVVTRLANWTGRIPIVVTALVIDICIHLSLFLWDADPDALPFFYLISTFWGISDAIWLSITSAMFGIAFPAEKLDAAFSQYLLWQCAGYAMAFGYSYFLCSLVKLIIMHVLLWVGVICYFIVEKIHANQEAYIINEMKI